MQDGINDLSKQTGVTTERATTDHFEGFDPSRTEVEQNVTVYDDFVTTGEESALLREIEPRFKRLRCESSHWDDVSRSSTVAFLSLPFCSAE